MGIVSDLGACQLEEQLHGFGTLAKGLLGFSVRMRRGELPNEVIHCTREFKGAFTAVPKVAKNAFEVSAKSPMGIADRADWIVSLSIQSLLLLL